MLLLGLYAVTCCHESHHLTFMKDSQYLVGLICSEHSPKPIKIVSAHSARVYEKIPKRLHLDPFS